MTPSSVSADQAQSKRTHTPLEPGFGFRFPDFYRFEGLERLDTCFLGWIEARAPETHAALLAARASDRPPEGSPARPDGIRPDAALLLALAPHLEQFLSALFGLDDALAQALAQEQDEPLLHWAKWKFVRRQAVLGLQPGDLDGFDPVEVRAVLGPTFGFPSACAPAGVGGFDEAAFARAVHARVRGSLRQAPDAPAQLNLARRYAAWASTTTEGVQAHPNVALFHLPASTDDAARLNHLVRTEQLDRPVLWLGHAPPEGRRTDRVARPFDHTTPSITVRHARDQAAYCLQCHRQGNDSCSRGFADGRTDRSGAALPGCPLGVRISEFQTARTEGWILAALALIVIDNPMLAATGHRICNDCERACVFQQQEPVNIPLVESRVLRDVLELPWGFEVYSLLTRWNPLNLDRWLPAHPTGRTVLVAGQGPAGFTLAHHLLNAGHGVVAIDGLKVEPLPAGLAGDPDESAPIGAGPLPFEPLRAVSFLDESLEERTPAGFGGVMEYGITPRWNKQLLRVVRLLLERRAGYRLAGGVRFGGNIDSTRALAQGFDHIALCLGAGAPQHLQLPDGLARGIRSASDFLMALQLGGAARPQANVSLQVRLPVLVLGGGLTAVDTATEAQAWYGVQVERYLARHESLVALHGQDAVEADWTPAVREVALEWLAHGQALRAERASATLAGRAPRIAELIRSFGGVHIVYRKRMTDSPAWRLNPTELRHALEEGVGFLEQVSPVAVQSDPDGAVNALVLLDAATGATLTQPARTVLVGFGTHPNTVVCDEDPERFSRIGNAFFFPGSGREQPHRDDPKPQSANIMVHTAPDGRQVSALGDLHPAWAGNVVRAMASARQGARLIDAALRALPAPAPAHTDRAAWLNERVAPLRARIIGLQQLAPGTLEVTVHAPAAAAAFRPGEFFRLQNFEAEAGSALYAMEPLALTGASVDAIQGTVSLIVLQSGASSRLVQFLRPGEPVVLMGPVGTPTVLPARSRVVLVGGGLGNAVLFSMGRTLRAAGSQVLYFAGYRHAERRFRTADLEASADHVVWCLDEGPLPAPGRPGDRVLAGRLTSALLQWDHLPDRPQNSFTLDQADHMIVIGPDGLMAAVADVLRGPLRAVLRPDFEAIGSINAPMQCMLKAVCGQCLQICRQTDSQTGDFEAAAPAWPVPVFACAHQDQPLTRVDFKVLRNRLKQNAVHERQGTQWLDARLGPATSTHNM